MRLVLIGLAVLIVILVAAVLIGPSLIPASVYRDQIIAAAEKATGRPFKIDGTVAVSVFPTVKAHVEKASLGNAPGGKAPDMAEIGKLDVGLALLPLLSRHVEITSFVLNDAVIHLEVGADGKANWQFAAASQPAPGPGAAPSASTSTSPVSGLSLGDVRLVNGLVTYDNLKTGDHYELQQINTKIALPSLDKPLKIDGDAVYKAQKLTVELGLEKPRAALDGGTSALAVKLAGAPLTASIEGNATFGNEPAFVGTTLLNVPSVRALSAWLGNPISGRKGFGLMSISGKMSYGANNFAFTQAKLQFDEIHATGSVKGDLSGKVPLITGSLVTDDLDLRPYIGASETSSGASSSGASGAASPAGWSTEPIDASALRSFNASLGFTADKILVRDLKIGKSVLTLNVNGGVMTADLKQLALYGGHANGTVTIDGSGTGAKIASKMALAGLDLASFLHDFAKTDRFDGTGSFNVDVKGGGRSQRDIVQSLAGTAALNFKDGAIKGVDLVQIENAVNLLTGKNKQVDAAQTEAAANQAQGSGAETKFVSLGGTFNIANGVATTSDFKMVNNLVSFSGSGSLNLPSQTIDFRIAPGTSQKNGGPKVALLVKGPLAKPKFTPDVSGLVENQLNKALGKFLGGKNAKPSGASDNGKASPPPAQQILNGLFQH